MRHETAVHSARRAHVCLLFAVCSCSGSGAGGQGGTQSTASGGAADGGRSSGGSSASSGSPASGGVPSESGGAQATGGSASGSAALGGNSTGGAVAGSSAGSGVNTGGSSSAAGTSSGGLATTGGGNTANGGLSASGGTLSTSTGGSASGGSAGRAGAAGTGGSPLLVPAQGALLGAFVGTGSIAQLETILGRKLAIWHDFYGWTDDYMARVQSTLSAGKIPLITWEAWNNGVGTSLDDIIAGVHDTLIRTRADAARATSQKFFLRWGHEMNGNWYPWDGFHNGASVAAATQYIAAYRHIHDVFSQAGASNVLWVFCPNADSVPGDAWNHWSNYYPGDSYVDWLGFDGYNWGTVQTGSSWRTFQAIGSGIYAGLAAKGKPIMIPETASAELGGNKAAWISALLPTFQQTFPAIKALVWFHMNKETDWRIDSSLQARDSFVPMANDPYFNP